MRSVVSDTLAVEIFTHPTSAECTADTKLTHHDRKGGQVGWGGTPSLLEETQRKREKQREATVVDQQLPLDAAPYCAISRLQMVNPGIALSLTPIAPVQIASPVCTAYLTQDEDKCSKGRDLAVACARGSQRSDGNSSRLTHGRYVIAQLLRALFTVFAGLA